MSKEPEELREDKGGREGGDGQTGEGSILRYPALPRAQEPLPVPRGQGGLAHRGLHLPLHHGTDGRSSDRDGFPCSLSLAGQGSRTVREKVNMVPLSLPWGQ